MGALVPRGADRAAEPVAFLETTARDARAAALEARGMLVAELEGIGPSVRGRLAEAIDEVVERRLAARGAVSPGITSGSDRDATLSDQLYRARRAGAAGIAIVLGPLRPATGPGGALEPEDSSTLRFLARAAGARPVVLVLDEGDEATGAYEAPVRLGEMIGRRAGPARAESATETVAETETEATAEPVLAAPTPAVRLSAGVAVVEREEKWRAWTLQLSAARGPQPLAVLERLFAESYMPLTNAIAAGLDEPRARAARDEFASTFSRGYTDAFATFSSGIKRPKMVLDAFEVAARIGRLHGARSIRVLVVDAMRWDVARRVGDRVALKLGARASLTDELLLWSALPSTSARQLETLARGVEALRAPAVLDEEADPARGRSAEYVRRLRVGAREIHKLDLIESRVRTLRGHVLAQLAEISECAADAIARHAEALAPRTLLFVTGDHGFALERAGGVHEGGASPEEVLVGAFALLVGDVH